MAVTGYREVGNPSASFSPQGVRTYQRVFHVDIDAPTLDGPRVVWDYFSTVEPEADRLFFGRLYEFGGASNIEKDIAFLNGANFRAISDADDHRTYEMTVSYGAPTGDNPLATSAPAGGFNPIEVEIDYAQFEEVVERDNDGKPIFNSARDPYNPGVTRDNSRYVVTITRNESNTDFDLFNRMKDTVNKTVFLGRPPRCVKAKPPRARRAWNPDSGYYWVVTYQFEINDREYRLAPVAGTGGGSFWDPTPPGEPGDPELGELIGQGWDKVILDAGFRYLDGTTRKLITVDSKPVQDPVPLDGEGGVLPADEPPVYRVFRVYPEFEYNDLGFGL